MAYIKDEFVTSIRDFVGVLGGGIVKPCFAVLTN